MSSTHSTESEVEASPEKPLPIPPRSKSSRWTTLAALAIAVIAAAVAIAAWFRPALESSSPTFTDQQTAQAKKNVCSAYTAVHQGVVRNTHLTDSNPNDPAGQLAIAANARLALLGGGAYLRDTVAAQPATPADLAQAVNSVANTIEQLGVGYLEGANNIVLDPLRHDLDSQVEQINKLCG
ncbi:MAG: hypothetical protein QOE52_1983 [Mycobacterium sp.]|jgi:hypothetical protein|nr:hypothetical protein [Mycobacterium sp.]